MWLGAHSGRIALVSVFGFLCGGAIGPLSPFRCTDDKVGGVDRIRFSRILILMELEEHPASCKLTFEQLHGLY